MERGKEKKKGIGPHQPGKTRVEVIVGGSEKEHEEVYYYCKDQS